jgi:hypothetical protein
VHEVITQKKIDFQKVNVSGTLDRGIPIVQADLDVASSGPWCVGVNLLSVITDMKRYSHRHTWDFEAMFLRLHSLM